MIAFKIYLGTLFVLSIAWLLTILLEDHIGFFGMWKLAKFQAWLMNGLILWVCVGMTWALLVIMGC